MQNHIIKHRGIAVSALLLFCAASVFQGCSNGTDSTKPAPAAATPAVAVANGTDDDYDIANDPVLGWWRYDGDADDEAKVAFLWPTENDDTHALRTIRFLNDGMATNGCCAGAEWVPEAPKFYKVVRGVAELYYMPDASTLYFLERGSAEENAADFQKIINAVKNGESPEALAQKGQLAAFGKYRRLPSAAPRGLRP
jgi:hypothetical protein